MDVEATSKVATDPILLKSLAKQGIDAQEVEFAQDYAPRHDPVTGAFRKEHSPYAKFYRHQKSNKRFMVVSGLPKVKAKGRKIEAGWLWAKNKYYSKANLFSAIVEGRQISVTCSTDQSVTWLPQLFLDGEEVSAIAETAVLLEIDPTNENYHQNVLEWDYGICKRRVRIIEGRLREWWVFDQDPNGEIRIKHNNYGSIKLRLGIGQSSDGIPLAVGVEDDTEVVSAQEFARAVFPVEVGASPETFYSTSADGTISSRDDNYDTAHDATTGDDISLTGLKAWLYFSFLSGNPDGEYWDVKYFGYFDTSSLPDGCTITDVTLAIRGSAGNLAEYENAMCDLQPFEGTQGDTLELADFDAHGSTVLTDDASPWEYPISTDNYNTVTFNAAGRAIINKTGTTYICIRNKGDVDDTPPSGDNHQVFWTNEQGAGYLPKMVVTYTTSETAYDTMVGSPTSWAWEKCDYGGAEKCPVGLETSWAWEAPSDGGADKTPQGSPTSFSWGSE